MLKYILVIYITAAGTSEQMPEWYDSKPECEAVGKTVESAAVSYLCIPVKY